MKPETNGHSADLFGHDNKVKLIQDYADAQRARARARFDEDMSAAAAFEEAWLKSLGLKVTAPISNKVDSMLPKLFELVSDYSGISVERIRSDRRFARLVRPRFLISFLAVEVLGFELREIETATGHHFSTVRHAVRAVANNLSISDPWYVEAVNALMPVVLAWKHGEQKS